MASTIAYLYLWPTGSMSNATTKLGATHGKFNELYTDLESEKNVCTSGILIETTQELCSTV